MVKFNIREKPRIFRVGEKNNIKIKEVGFVYLKNNEQITIINENKKNYDFVKKSWGYYATPSINGRLKNFGFRTFLVSNTQKKIYIFLVNKDKIKLFKNYIKKEKIFIVKELTNYKKF